mmetsp:Transcript_52816/g.136770  ORF Transcript_52816/g.136770 Transcript_52816/m.136770 type:complete len:265 (-) Transcript_52816:2712-3506(-)
MGTCETAYDAHPLAHGPCAARCHSAMRAPLQAVSTSIPERVEAACASLCLVGSTSTFRLRPSSVFGLPFRLRPSCLLIVRASVASGACLCVYHSRIGSAQRTLARWHATPAPKPSRVWQRVVCPRPGCRAPCPNAHSADSPLSGQAEPGYPARAARWRCRVASGAAECASLLGGVGRRSTAAHGARTPVAAPGTERRIRRATTLARQAEPAPLQRVDEGAGGNITLLQRPCAAGVWRRRMAHAPGRAPESLPAAQAHACSAPQA